MPLLDQPCKRKFTKTLNFVVLKTKLFQQCWHDNGMRTISDQDWLYNTIYTNREESIHVHIELSEHTLQGNTGEKIYASIFLFHNLIFLN